MKPQHSVSINTRLPHPIHKRKHHSEIDCEDWETQIPTYHSSFSFLELSLWSQSPPSFTDRVLQSICTRWYPHCGIAAHHQRRCLRSVNKPLLVTQRNYGKLEVGASRLLWRLGRLYLWSFVVLLKTEYKVARVWKYLRNHWTHSAAGFHVVYCESETWSVTLREKTVLCLRTECWGKKLFGPKRDEMTGDWRKLLERSFIICIFCYILLQSSNGKGWNWLACSAYREIRNVAWVPWREETTFRI